MTEEEYDFMSDVEELLQDNWGDWDIEDKLKSNGYDSLISHNGDEIVIFDEKKITILDKDKIEI